MRNHPDAVAIHPYFKVHPGKDEEARALLVRMVESTRHEPACLFYGFTASDEHIFCQEAYVDADGVLEHLGRVGELLGAMLQIADLVRLELHGPAEQLRKLEAPTKDLSPTFFAWVVGID